MKKAKLNILFGKKKIGDKENVVSTITESAPPKITLDTLTLNSSLDILPTSSTSDTPERAQELKPSATPNQENSTGLFDEILSELNTGKSSAFDDELSLNLELSKLLETSSTVKVQPTSTFSNSSLSNQSTNKSVFLNNNNEANNSYNRFNLPSKDNLSNNLIKKNELLQPSNNLATHKPLDSETETESDDESSDNNSFIRIEQSAPNPNGMNGKKPINPVQRRKDIGQKTNQVENWAQDVNPKDGDNNILDRMKDRHRAEARAAPSLHPPPPSTSYPDDDRYYDYDRHDRYERNDRYDPPYSRDPRDRDDHYDRDYRETRDPRNPRSDTYSEDSRDMREDYRYGSRDRDDYRRDPRPRNNDDRPIYDDRLRNNTRYPRERNNDYEKGISSNGDHLGYRQNNGTRIIRRSPSSSASSHTSESSIDPRLRSERSVIKVSKSRSFEKEKIKESHEPKDGSLSRQSSIASRKNTSPGEFHQSSTRNLHDRVVHKGSHKDLKQSRSSTSSGGSSNHEERIVEESNYIKSISRKNLRVPFDETARDSILSVDSDIVPLGTKYGITAMNAHDEGLSQDSLDESSDDEPLDTMITVKRTISRKKSMPASFKPSSSDFSSDDDDETYKGPFSDNEPPIPPRGKTFPPQQTRSLPSHIRKDRLQNGHSRSDSYDSNSALNGYRDRDEFGYHPSPPPPHVLREKPANRYPVPPHQYRDEPPYPYREEVPYDGSRYRYANYPLPPEPFPLDHTPENSKKVPLIEMAGYRYDQNKRNQTIQPFIASLDKRIRSPSPPNRYPNRGYPRERERYPQERGEYPPQPRQYNPPPPRSIKNGYDDRGERRERGHDVDRYDRYNDRYNDRYGNDRYKDRFNDRHDDKYSDRLDDRYDDRYNNDRYDDRYSDRYNDRYDRYDD
ncbi:814_t:CDS:2 [Funneliformis caledonium]|uniref:814_t:CDS:1 n=1 Tax=Funneliformis caledonium TaxID=1117310 RepID=A0A9N9BIT3_9GLOM|nr:814_t:CDS:2 [Funneliformis caledonium]